MKEYYEKFDHSKLIKFKEFLYKNFDLEEYNRDTINEARSLLNELIELNGEVLDDYSKELYKAINFLNDPFKDKSSKDYVKRNTDPDLKVYLDEEVCDIINKLAYIATNRKIKIK